MLTPNEVKTNERDPSIQQIRIASHGNWVQQKEKLKNMFGLTYEELSFAHGKKEEMLTRIQIKLGLTKEEFRAVLSSL
jgi:hypothetical protein